ncbi:MAG: HAMP domain-containing histidine kinase [Gammaproteobacteria bacterium]|nr:HAMP domain-containing histidine kinase [Gammaproteobacteria bacterium]
MTQEFSFDMREFNRLPKPEVFPLENPSLDDLKQAFPFLFKPNRVLALHPKEEKSGVDGGWPLKDPKSRWLIALDLPDKFEYPFCAAVISREGRFSLWSYRPSSSSDEKGGLFLIPLLQPDLHGRKKTPISNFYLSPEGQEPRIKKALPRNFNLLRFIRHYDDEGVMLLRLITPQWEHVVKLDFGDGTPGSPVPFHHTVRFYTYPKNTSAFRQIGGWGCGKAFFRIENDESRTELYVDSLQYGKPVPLPEQYTSLELIATAERDGFLAVGGGCLWVRSKPKADFIDINRQKSLRGFVRSLELIPSPASGDKQPLILAGCDDFYLYILDWEGKLLQKAAMGGYVDAILYLNGQPGKWYDVAVLVRNKGLFCARLFYKRFRREEKIKTDRELFVDHLWKLIGKEGDPLLVKWLHFPDLSDKLLAVTAVLNRPSAKTVELFAPDQHLLFGLNDHVTAYLAHVLQRKIRHIAESQRWSEIQRQHLRHYLNLLLHMTEGPFRTRMAVRGLEGWLLMLLKGKFFKDNQAEELLDQLVKKLPDAKRVLRALAEEVYLADLAGDTEKAMETMSILLGLKERLKFERIFNELVLLPDTETGRVDGAAIIADPGITCPQQIFCRRGQEKIASFFIQADILKIEPKEGDWQHLLDIEADRNPTVRIQSLVPINEEWLAVVAGRRVGLARKGEDKVFWQHEMPVPLLSAASDNGSHGVRLAVGGEWRPGGPWEAVYVFEWDGQADLHRLKSFLDGPQDWKERIRFSALAWDGNSGLWAVTDKGDLFYWPEAGGSTHTSTINPMHLASTGSLQHALVVLEDLVVCGGEDGVLRAFDTAGRLLWTRILPGTVRSITRMSPADNPDGRFSDLAVITDAEHMVLFNRAGKQEGSLQIPDHFLFSMVSRPPKRAKAPHYFIGTLWGEVRLVEEVPKGWSMAQYLTLDPELEGKEPRRQIESGEAEKWNAIQKTIDEYAEKVDNDLELWRSWCGPKDPKKESENKPIDADLESWRKWEPKEPERGDWEWTMDEPLRTVWAARRLLASPFEEKYDIILKMLWGTRNQFGYYSTRELRIYLFAGLGCVLNEIPGKYHLRLRELCKLVKDGALASLLLHIPDTVNHNNGLLRGILYTAYRKTLEGQPFVSAAILQRLQHLSDLSSREADFFILGMLKEFDTPGNTIHPGFIEGLLAMLFQRLDINQGSLLFSLSHMLARYPVLARALLAKNKKDKKNKKKKNIKFQQIFYRLLDLHGGVILSRGNWHTWTVLSRELKKKVTDIPAVLARLKESPVRGEKTGNTDDISALEGFQELFPDASVSIKSSRLPEVWQECVEKTREFRQGVARIAHHITPVPAGMQWLDESTRELERYVPKLPVMDKFEAAWRRAWLNELHRMRAMVIGEQMPLLGSEGPAEEPIRRFFQAMRDNGFARGRFYRIIQVPGCDGILQLTYAEGDLRKPRELPVGHPLSGILAEQFAKYHRKNKSCDGKLFFTVHSRNQADRLDEGILFWDQIIHKDDWESWLEVPVLQKESGENSYYPAAIFVFDLPEDESFREVEKQMEFHTPDLCPILRDVMQILALEARKKQQEYQSRLSVLDGRLSGRVDRLAIEKALLEVAKEISGASDGLLITHEGASDELAIRAVSGDLQDFLSRTYFRLNEDFYPVVSCWKAKKALYIPDWAKSEMRHSVLKRVDLMKFNPQDPESGRKWLADGIGSLVAMPIWSEEDMAVGAISLQSPHPYTFNRERVQALKNLLQRVRWFLHAAELNDQRRRWERAFVHEIRSDLIPVSKGIDAVLRDPPPGAKWFLTEAKRHCGGLLDLSQNFMDIQANPQADKNLIFSAPVDILKEYLELYDTLINLARQKIELDPKAPEARIWQCCLLGSREVFGRVFRNILDNALKHGGREAIIRINASIEDNMWLLTMSNPGRMTEEEDALKFSAYEKPIHVRHSGAHVGLAASRMWIHAYGGELKLDNIQHEGEERVQALLRWPLAESKEECS